MDTNNTRQSNISIEPHEQPSTTRNSLESYGSQHQLLHRTSLDSKSFNSVAAGETAAKSSGPTCCGTSRKRCLIITALALVIFCAIFFPILFLVIIPSVAQKSIQQSELVFTRSIISDAKANEFILSTSGTVSNAGAFDADIETVKPISIYWKDLLLGEMNMPVISARGGSATLESSSPVKVMNETTFGEFSRTMMTQSEFEWRLVSQVRVKSLGMTFENLEFDKVIKMRGFNSFENSVKITSFDLPENDPQKGIRVAINSVIDNPSIIGLKLGKASFKMYNDKTLLGEVTCDNMTILPGKNTVAMNGRLLPIQTNVDRERVSQLFTMFVTGVDTKLKVVGDKVDVGVPVPWLNAGFDGFTMNVPFDAAKQLKLIESVNMDTLDLKFDPARPYAPTLSSSGVVAKFKMPFAFPLTISKVKQSADLVIDGHKVARVEAPWSPATGSSAVGQLTTDIMNAPFTAYPGQEQNFDNFMTKVTFSTDVVTVGLIGTADTVAETAIGPFSLSGIKFESDMKIKGIGGLNTVPPKIVSVKVTGGDASKIDMAIEVVLTNPSNVRLSMGHTTFLIKYKGAVLGTTSMDNLVLNMGTNQLKSIAAFQPGPEAMGQARELFSNFAMGIDTNIEIAGYEGSTEVASLRPALSRMSIGATLPAVKEKMINAARFMIRLGTIVNKIADAGMDLYNPLDTTVTILDVDATMYTKGFELGTVKQDIRDAPIVIPAKQTTRSRRLELRVVLNPQTMGIVAGTIMGQTIMIDVDAKMTVSIGGYVTVLVYKQTGISCKLERVEGGNGNGMLGGLGGPLNLLSNL